VTEVQKGPQISFVVLFLTITQHRHVYENGKLL